MKARYLILDEPQPGPLASLAVRPLWPLFAAMLAGSWLALPWFIVNGFAVGSPSRWREVLLASVGLGGSMLIATLLLAGGEALGNSGIEYALIVPVVWKIGIAYGLFVMQRRSFELFEYYGGTVRNGLFVVVIGAFFLRKQVLGGLSTLVQLVLS